MSERKAGELSKYNNLDHFLKIVRKEVKPPQSSNINKKKGKWDYEANEFFANSPELQKMYKRLKKEYKKSHQKKSNQ